MKNNPPGYGCKHAAEVEHINHVIVEKPPVMHIPGRICAITGGNKYLEKIYFTCITRYLLVLQNICGFVMCRMYCFCASRSSL